ncbi:MAG: hypothetical protein IJ164_07940 [Duodenibacillus sp.]|nr:hypothetical protein [Duodenibacillus sp.]
MSLTRRTLLTLILAAPVAGCGFRLRGAFSVPFKTLFLDADMDTPFGANLKRQLEGGSDVTIVTDRQQAEAVLQILSIQKSRTAGASSSGETRQYKLTETVRFRVANPKGVEYMEDTSVSGSRFISYSADKDYLSRENEEATVYSEIESDLVAQMMRRIERTLNQVRASERAAAKE